MVLAEGVCHAGNPRPNVLGREQMDTLEAIHTRRSIRTYLDRPFGSLFGLHTHCDARLGENEVINFNAGDHGISVSMRYADYVPVEEPELGMFAE